MVCTFFGHRDTPHDVEERLKAVLTALITTKGVDTFYIGHQGNFDFIARKVVLKLKEEFPHINYSIILAYIPTDRENFFTKDYEHTIYPEELEKTPQRCAISKRNRWLIEHSDIVVTYVRHTFGSSSQFKELAEKRGRTVLNIV